MPVKHPPAFNMRDLSAWVEENWGRAVVSAAQGLWELGLVDFEQFAHLHASKPAAVREYLQNRMHDRSLDEEQFEHLKAVIARTPEVDAARFAVDPAALERLPWADAVHYGVVPLGMLEHTLYAASPTPTDRDLQNALSVRTGCTVLLAWAPKEQVHQRLSAALGTTLQQVAAATAEATPIADLQALLASAQSETRARGMEAERSETVDVQSSVVQLVKRIITDAHARNASDIHIETNPGGEDSRVRFRVDGDLEEYLKVPADLRAALVSRIKVMSKLDISEHRRPQDGKISFAEFSDVQLELRVAIVPTHDGAEDVVMRLLASSRPTPLDKLGFSARDAAIIKRVAQRPYGLILACGPTGSGKTTTLHSLIAHLNTESRKIWTAEDPIEITQPGLRQLQVNPKIGVTFASAMRAFLRADPDIVMIGEVRDEETARVCIDASLTGHLVLSTLHTNSAAESVVRLLELGIDPMNFGDSLLGVIAQRLVRALCPHCRQAEPLDAQALDALAADYVEGTGQGAALGRERLLAAALEREAPATYRAVGCERCGHKGYKGRLGIYEILENGFTMKELIHSRAHTGTIFQTALGAGTRSLKQDALEKVVAGRTDLKQAATVFI